MALAAGPFPMVYTGFAPPCRAARRGGVRSPPWAAAGLRCIGHRPAVVGGGPVRSMPAAHPATSALRRLLLLRCSNFHALTRQARASPTSPSWLRRGRSGRLPEDCPAAWPRRRPPAAAPEPGTPPGGSSRRRIRGPRRRSRGLRGRATTSGAGPRCAALRARPCAGSPGCPSRRSAPRRQPRRSPRA